MTISIVVVRKIEKIPSSVVITNLATTLVSNSGSEGLNRFYGKLGLIWVPGCLHLMCSCRWRNIAKCTTRPSNHSGLRFCLFFAGCCGLSRRKTIGVNTESRINANDPRQPHINLLETRSQHNTSHLTARYSQIEKSKLYLSTITFQWMHLSRFVWKIDWLVRFKDHSDKKSIKSVISSSQTTWRFQ